ncbi:hypothetical protein [Clostridium saccharoperbutylacetonicum]|jgi:hypothetical protein|uniref:Uncharacterized protein n=1 Tax=Clostridium saccharoperbutylacetonicum N1-4(HMT) TaxID=931276 RepID=M1MJT6_9CLOT|nr:hypothetical protein [Clostridium saccharoperbutylacetonicum]AGF56573.1 hypothetical protein Cspa_c28100 [Clostridium saccharoperbutylacetonicum N1-4(HMT)]AQR95247.1 hypothetical protein CLSAP_25630 [Clostridium saccharoperbutylacetonicum]NRT62676.1 hypothetical protein [Clostridium saccharoperbutylacetonicum]NSB26025.1 hypothetical protein [Clostridium saccharoperbutylacetonicum]NSB31101.1 hypothetical protein [Clostridium saccharoperbutylacetonicum]
MNPYQLIIAVQQRMQQDPNFANKFNQAIIELNKIPGLQQKVVQIAQLNTEAKRQEAMDKLPKDARNAVAKILSILEEYNIHF